LRTFKSEKQLVANLIACHFLDWNHHPAPAVADVYIHIKTNIGCE